MLGDAIVFIAVALAALHVAWRLMPRATRGRLAQRLGLGPVTDPGCGGCNGCSSAGDRGLPAGAAPTAGCASPQPVRFMPRPTAPRPRR